MNTKLENTVNRTADEARKTVNRTADEARKTVNRAAKTANRTADDARKTVNRTAADVRKTVNRTAETVNRTADEARGRYAGLLRNARKRTESAADRVVMGKKPVKTLTGLGLKLNAISHKTADQVLKQQTRLIENQIDAVATRLQAIADARDLGELVRTQLRLTPQNVSRFGADARDTLSIVAGAGSEVRDVVKGTIQELRGKPIAARKTSRKNATGKKTARKTAKKSTRKTAKKRVPTAAAVRGKRAAA